MKLLEVRSITIDWHAWRGFARGSDGNNAAVTAGWVTLSVSALRLSERLRRAIDVLRRAESR